jgi:hypothetical protein
LSETPVRIVDRTTLFMHYDKLYTIRGKKPSLKVVVVIADIGVEELPSYLAKETLLGGEGLVHVKSQPIQ